MASRFECPRCQTVFVKDVAGDAAFVECPSCGALALPAGDATDGALERALSGPQVMPSSSSTSGMDSTEAEQEAAPRDPADPAPGMFSNLLDQSRSDPGGAPVASPVAGSRNAPELEFDFGGIDLPDLPPPPTTRASQEGAAVDDGSGKFKTGGAAVHALPPDALAALAAEAEAGPTENEKKVPWSGLSEDAFGDLEKAFDEMALKPAPPTGPRGGLTADEERFLRGDELSSPGGRPPPLRRVEGERTDRASSPPRPPPKKGAAQKRPRPTHFELSAEARRLAFLPLKGDGEASVSQPRPRMEPVRDERPAPQRAMVATSSASAAEETDVVRPGREPQRRPVPSAFAGLTFGRAAALVLVAAVLGGAGGAYLAPKPKTAATPRARAELRFADGNRFYDAGRFDDALGAFRGALSLDPTFALAHRAKGAALAKLSRFDEAAEAYDEYLKLEPHAVDATDVNAAITRRRGSEPKP